MHIQDRFEETVTQLLSLKIRVFGKHVIIEKLTTFYTLDLSEQEC